MIRRRVEHVARCGHTVEAWEAWGPDGGWDLDMLEVWAHLSECEAAQ